MLGVGIKRLPLRPVCLSVARQRMMGSAREGATGSPKFSSLDQIVVFGDSLSDNGNGVFSWTKGNFPHHPAYHGARFTDGQVWAEVLADRLQLPLRDYAVGGATTSNAFVQGYAYSEIDENIRVAVPSMVEQVKTWIQSAGPARASKDNEDTLFVLEAGINDGWAKPSLDPTKVVERGQQTCLNLLTGVGARNFLLIGIPDFGQNPYFLNLPDRDDRVEVGEAIHRYVVGMNQCLRALAKTTTTQAEHGCSRIAFVDLYDLFQRVGEAPTRYALRDEPFKHARLHRDDEGHWQVHSEDREKAYLYFDSYHPSWRGHELIAAEAHDAVLDTWGT